MEEPFRNLLIMTVSIDPGSGAAQVVRKDPLVRLADYDQALRFWLRLPDPELRHILLIENTGYPLDVLRRTIETENKLGKSVEFVTGPWNDFPAESGYGCGELKMLEEGISRSDLAARASYLIKVTGRLTFPALPRLLKRLPPEFLFAVDSRNNVRFAKSPQVFIVSQLMILNNVFYRAKMRGLAQKMIDGKYVCVENVFWDVLMPFRGLPGAIFRWPINADPVGQAAHWAKDYRSPRQRFTNAARGIARRLTPWWWI